MSAIRVVIVHDDVIVRQGIETFVTRAYEDALVTCLACTSPASQLSLIEADLLVCYHSIGDSNAIHVLACMEANISPPPVLVISALPETEAAPICIAAGASGFLPNSAPSDEFFTAMNRLLAGGTYFSATAAKSAFAAIRITETEVPDAIRKLLSKREIEVFSGLGEGQPVRSIARRLGISAKTVEAHRENIKNKLNLHTASEVVIAGSQWLSSGR